MQDNIYTEVCSGLWAYGIRFIELRLTKMRLGNKQTKLKYRVMFKSL